MVNPVKQMNTKQIAIMTKQKSTGLVLIQMSLRLLEFSQEEHLDPGEHLITWHGPYRIVKQLSPVNSKLRNSANRLVAAPVHVIRMKLYYDAKDRPIEPPAFRTDNGDFSLTEDELPVDSFAPEIPRAEEPLDPVDGTSTVTESNQLIYREVNEQDKRQLTFQLSLTSKFIKSRKF